MTTRHVVIGLMQYMHCRTHQECEIRIGLPGGSFSRMYHGQRSAFSLSALDRMQAQSGLTFDQLMAWYREPEVIKN